MELFRPHAIKKACTKAETILIELVEGGKLFPGELGQDRCSSVFSLPQPDFEISQYMLRQRITSGAVRSAGCFPKSVMPCRHLTWLQKHFVQL